MATITRWRDEPTEVRGPLRRTQLASGCRSGTSAYPSHTGHWGQKGRVPLSLEPGATSSIWQVLSSSIEWLEAR